MRPELWNTSGFGVLDLGCGTSVPGRHRPSPRVSSGRLLGGRGC